MIQAKIKLLTGLHIGGGDDTMNIGGIDSSVIKREVFANEDGSINYEGKGTKIIEPYIPGSSLKGKVRSLLEHAFGLISYKNAHPEKFNEKEIGKSISSDFIQKCDDEFLKKKAYIIVALFGESAGSKSVVKPQITRAIFRDAFLSQTSRRLYLEEKIKLSEEKAENSIDRISIRANPRFIERVPTGVEFEFEVVLRKFEEDKILPLKKTLLLGLKLLENDSLGGGGSRGSGKVKFDGIEDEDFLKNIKALVGEIEENLKSFSFEF